MPTPTIPEGTCAPLTLTAIDSETTLIGQTPNVWSIYPAEGQPAVATGNFPGNTGTNTNGWNVTGDFTTATVCPPTGTTQAGTYKLRIPKTTPHNSGDTVYYYDASFFVSAATCAKPAAPVFTGLVSGSAIQLTGTK